MNETIGRLVHMANQISRNLQTHSDPAAAIADHIAHFWDPRMKALIFAHSVEGGSDLDADAAAAVALLRSDGPPPPQSEATAAQGGSDAG